MHKPNSKEAQTQRIFNHATAALQKLQENEKLTATEIQTHSSAQKPLPSA